MIVEQRTALKFVLDLVQVQNHESRSSHGYT